MIPSLVHYECVPSTCFEPLLQVSGKNGAELSASSGTGPDAISTGIGWYPDLTDTQPWLEYDPARKESETDPKKTENHNPISY